jgi:hypothetical protein
MEYCAEQGLRLPTIREFAEWASGEFTDDINGKEPCGASGISETEKKGYMKIHVNQWEGMPDLFFYGQKGYVPPTQQIVIDTLWSSSNSSTSARTGFVFSRSTGHILVDYFRADEIAALCVRTHKHKQ